MGRVVHREEQERWPRWRPGYDRFHKARFDLLLAELDQALKQLERDQRMLQDMFRPWERN